MIRTLIFLTGCASLAEQFAGKAEELGMKTEVQTGSRFQHVLYRNTGLSSKTLHIYLDGDGTPGSPAGHLTIPRRATPW